MIKIISYYKISLIPKKSFLKKISSKKNQKTLLDFYEKRTTLGNKIASSLIKKNKDLKIAIKIYNDYMYIYGYRSN